MASKITRTTKTAELEVMYFDGGDLSTGYVYTAESKINYKAIADELGIDENFICEVTVTRTVKEEKREMSTDLFLAYARPVTPYKYNENGEPIYKREYGYFYRTITNDSYVYTAFDINEKKIVTMSVPKELKPGKVYEHYKVLKLNRHDESENMYRMSESDWYRLSTVSAK